MPIKPENADKYPADWPERRARALARTGNRCHFCGVHNGHWIVRVRRSDLWAYTDPQQPDDAVLAAVNADHIGLWRDGKGNRVRLSEISDHVPYAFDGYDGNVTACKVVLTIAHLDHKLDDHSDANLAPLCQRCHLTHDAADRRAARVAAQPELPL